MLGRRDHHGGLAEVEADGEILADGVGELADVAVHLNGVTRRPGAVQKPSPGGLHQVPIVANGPDGWPRATDAEVV